GVGEVEDVFDVAHEFEIIQLNVVVDAKRRNQRAIGDDAAIGEQKIARCECPKRAVQLGGKRHQWGIEAQNIEAIQAQILPHIEVSEEFGVAGTNLPGGAEHIPVRYIRTAIIGFALQHHKIFDG